MGCSFSSKIFLCSAQISPSVSLIRLLARPLHHLSLALKLLRCVTSVAFGRHTLVASCRSRTLVLRARNPIAQQHQRTSIMATSAERVAHLRRLMSEHDVRAYLVPSADPHLVCPLLLSFLAPSSWHSADSRCARASISRRASNVVPSSRTSRARRVPNAISHNDTTRHDTTRHDTIRPSKLTNRC